LAHRLLGFSVWSNDQRHDRRPASGVRRPASGISVLALETSSAQNASMAPSIWRHPPDMDPEHAEHAGHRYRIATGSPPDRHQSQPM
jgi:hypothetical protein